MGVLIGLLFSAVACPAQDMVLHPEQLSYDSEAEAVRYQQWSQGAEVPALDFLLSADPELAAQERSALCDLQSGVNELVSKKASLPAIFRVLRERHLLQYEPVATFGETLREGKFNCVSSSALTAWVLQEAGIPVRIMETPRHVLVYARPGRNWIRVETTSEARAVFRRQKHRAAWSSEINLHQLVGLQHYNAALDALDAKNSTLAFDRLSRAYLLYRSPRIWEMLLHAGGMELDKGLGMVLAEAPELGLPHLERAMTAMPNEKLAEQGVVAAILQIVERRPNHLQGLRYLEEARTRYAFINGVQEVEQVYSDLLLVLAWEALQNDRLDKGMAFLNRLETSLNNHPEWVQHDMAGEVYGAAWAQLVRLGDADGAEAVLQRGLKFAPRSRNLERKRAAMLAMDN